MVKYKYKQKIFTKKMNFKNHKHVNMKKYGENDTQSPSKALVAKVKKDLKTIEGTKDLDNVIKAPSKTLLKRGSADSNWKQANPSGAGHVYVEGVDAKRGELPSKKLALAAQGDKRSKIKRERPSKIPFFNGESAVMTENQKKINKKKRKSVNVQGNEDDMMDSQPKGKEREGLKDDAEFPTASEHKQSHKESDAAEEDSTNEKKHKGNDVNPTRDGANGKEGAGDASSYVVAELRKGNANNTKKPRIKPIKRIKVANAINQNNRVESLSDEENLSNDGLSSKDDKKPSVSQLLRPKDTESEAVEYDSSRAELDVNLTEEELNKIIPIRQTKKQKHQERKAALKNPTDKEKERNEEYLRKWKYARDEWKFQKLRQTSIQHIMFNEEQISNELWPIALEYLCNSSGTAKTRLHKHVCKVLKSQDAECFKSETDEKRNEIINSVTYQRARDIMQSLNVE